MSNATNWIKKFATRADSTLLPKSAPEVDPAAAPPSEPSKKLLGTSAAGMSELDADMVLGAGGYAAPGVAAAAPISPATSERSATAAGKTLDAAEGGSIRAILQRPHSSQVPLPKPYTKRLHGDLGHVPEDAKGQGR